MIHEIEAKTALHFHGKTFASNWDLNIYRGCGHGCAYCFAQYSHRYLNTDCFFSDIFVKTNIAGALDTQLSKRSWENHAVTIGGVSDSYQPIEKKYKLMPKVLRTMINHENPTIITTKSTLILRDFELIRELSKVAEVHVGTSVSTLDEKTRKIVEPGASPTKDRLEMLGEFSKIGIKTTVLLMPIIPLITDQRDNLEEIFKLCKKYNVSNMFASALHLRGNTKNKFFRFLEKKFPELVPKYRILYKSSNVAKKYGSGLYGYLSMLRKKHQIFDTYSKPKPVRKTRLFD